MARRFDDAKRDDWRRRLAKFDASGLTIVDFCRREQVSQASFYYWSKRIRDRDDSETPKMKTANAGLATVTSGERSDWVEILIGDEIRVRMPAAGPKAVAALVKQLQVAAEPVTTNRFQRIELTA